MRAAFAPLLASLLALGIASCGGPCPRPAASGASSDRASSETSPDGRALKALFDEEWEHELREHPVWASSIGERRYDRAWDDMSPQAFAKRQAHEVDVLKKLQAFPTGALSTRERLDYDLFRQRYEIAVEGHRFGLHLLPVNQRGGLQSADEIADELPFDKAQHYEDWVARLGAFPAHVDQTIALMREGMRRKIVHPKIVMARIPAQIDKQIVEGPEKSPFFAPFTKPSKLAPKDQERLATAAKKEIAAGVVPAMKRFRAFFVDEYLPASMDGIGAARLPDGEAMYAHLARLHTTTKLTPDEIHVLGLKEVSRIRRAMQAIMDRVGHKETLAEFFRFLRTDPRFFYKTREELFAAYGALAKRVDPKLVKLFGTLPRTPYGVESIPDAVAPDTTTAYYREPAADGSRAGSYFVNLYKPETRPSWEMMALSLHESVPGHHLQIALALELPDLPRFRKHAEYTAFVEGWGLYAESLGDEMGLYDNEFSKFGQLTYEMWRAVRLVVDTGMHVKQWDRQRAIDFFLENAPKQELDVTNEIDRYIVWPGQALAYKIGELRIQELRKRAEKELGARFDVRRFHDAVLGAGALPLDILERRVVDWLAQERR